jgi:hypothetical protein
MGDPRTDLSAAATDGRPWSDSRGVLNAVLWILRTGAPWADLPPREGSKIMAIVDRHGLPVAIHAASASPYEPHLVPATLDARFFAELPTRRHALGAPRRQLSRNNPACLRASCSAQL